MAEYAWTGRPPAGSIVDSTSAYATNLRSVILFNEKTAGDARADFSHNLVTGAQVVLDQGQYASNTWTTDGITGGGSAGAGYLMLPPGAIPSGHVGTILAVHNPSAVGKRIFTAGQSVSAGSSAFVGTVDDTHLQVTAYGSAVNPFVCPSQTSHKSVTAITTDGTNTILYQNGTALGTAPIGFFNGNAQEFSFGTYGVSNGYDGVISAIYVWDRILTAAEVAHFSTAFYAPIIPAPPATAFTLTGPTSGTTGVASTTFTVTPNGALGQAETVALTDGGAGGTFTPTSLSFALSAAVGQTFTYTPASVGAKTLTATPSPAFGTAPTASYSATAPVATAFTLTGPASGTTGTASTAFTVTPNAALGQAETVALTDGGAGGTFVPTSLSFASGAAAAQTFTYAPASVGAKTLTATASPALGTAPTASYSATAPAATAFTLTGPASGTTGVASTAFTVTPNGALGQAETVALTDGGAGGTFTPTSLSFANAATAAQTFTYAPASVGAKTLTATASPALGTALTATYTSNASATVTTVTVSPATATVAGAATQQFTVVVAGTNSPAQTVTWAANLGTITAGGLYTAPASTASAQTATITATSTVDNTKSGTATVTVPVTPATVSAVTVSPSAPTVAGAATQQFTVVVTGTGSPAQSVTWAATLGTITAGGLYTAPASTASVQTATITATSTVDNTKSGTATATIPASVTVSAVTVTPATPTVAGAATQQFTVVVTGTGSPAQSVTWTATLGTITSGGLYTAPASTASAQTATITATSTVDNTKSGTATATTPATPAAGASPPSIQVTQPTGCRPGEGESAYLSIATAMGATDADVLPVVTYALHNQAVDAALAPTVTRVTKGIYRVDVAVPASYIWCDDICLLGTLVVAGMTYNWVVEFSLPSVATDVSGATILQASEHINEIPLDIASAFLQYTLAQYTNPAAPTTSALQLTGASLVNVPASGGLTTGQVTELNGLVDQMALVPKSGTAASLSTADEAALTAAGSGSGVLAALRGAATITIPGTHTTSGSPLVLTHAQYETLLASLAGGDDAATVPVAGGTATETYYLIGQPRVAANVVMVATVAYNAQGAQISRTDLYTAPATY